MRLDSRNNKMDMYHGNKPVHQDPFFTADNLITAFNIIIYNHKAWVRPAVNMAQPV